MSPPPPGGHYRPLQGPPEPSLDSYVRELYACGELGVLHKRITKREGFTWYPRGIHCPMLPLLPLSTV